MLPNIVGLEFFRRNLVHVCSPCETPVMSRSRSRQPPVAHCTEARGNLLRLGSASEPLKDRRMLVHFLRPLSYGLRQRGKRLRPGGHCPIGVAFRLANIAEQPVSGSNGVSVLDQVAAAFVRSGCERPLRESKRLGMSPRLEGQPGAHCETQCLS